MITTSDQTVVDDTQHRLEMLLWQARIHEKNGKKQEASKIREWVAGFLSSQPKEDVIKSVWRGLRKPSRATLDAIRSKDAAQRSVLSKGHFLRETETPLESKDFPRTTAIATVRNHNHTRLGSPWEWLSKSKNRQKKIK
jgi:hypothetical protein